MLQDYLKICSRIQVTVQLLNIIHIYAHLADIVDETIV